MYFVEQWVQTFENQKPVLDLLEEKEVSVPPPTQLKETKARRHVFRRAYEQVKNENKKQRYIWLEDILHQRCERVSIPLFKKKTKVRRKVFHNNEIQADEKRTNQIENDNDDY